MSHLIKYCEAIEHYDKILIIWETIDNKNNYFINTVKILEKYKNMNIKDIQQSKNIINTMNDEIQNQYNNYFHSKCKMLPADIMEKWITKISKLPYSSHGHKILYTNNNNNNIKLNFDIRIPKHELSKIQLNNLEKFAMIITGYKIEIEEQESMYCDYSY